MTVEHWKDSLQIMRETKLFLHWNYTDNWNLVAADISVQGSKIAANVVKTIYYFKVDLGGRILGVPTFNLKCVKSIHVHFTTL